MIKIIKNKKENKKKKKNETKKGEINKRRNIRKRKKSAKLHLSCIYMRMCYWWQMLSRPIVFSGNFVFLPESESVFEKCFCIIFKIK